MFVRQASGAAATYWQAGWHRMVGCMLGMTAPGRRRCAALLAGSCFSDCESVAA